jgi:pyrroloquinoline quinone biosynthesis protein D
MNTVIEDSHRPFVPPGFRLQWEAVQNAHVLLYPEGMVKLNASAGAILSRCNGTLTVTEIVADLEQTFGRAGLRPDVDSFLVLAREKGWVELEGSDGGDVGDGGRSQ